MGLLSALKWWYDPRTDSKKAYDKWNRETPLYRRTQELLLFIRGYDKPMIYTYTQDDVEFGDMFGTIRFATKENLFSRGLKTWIQDRGVKGIYIDDVWYSPEVIERIELGESKTEVI